MHILAVDDETGALNVLTRAVLQAVPQAQVHGFSDPLSALSFVDGCACEIAFLDIEMAGMDGISLARRLKQKCPRLNIIFVTGYPQYAGDAFSLHASGYLNKPVLADDIRTEMENLRFPVRQPECRIYARTFGNFDLLVDGQPVAFPRSKAKEVLAYLIDRRGCSVTRRELAAALFEDQDYSRESQNYLTKILRALSSTLESEGIGDLLLRGLNSYAVDTALFSCDLYDFESCSATPEQLNRFRGEYMSQYSWAEDTLARLLWTRP